MMVPKLCPLVRGGGWRALGLGVCWGVGLAVFGVQALVGWIVYPWATGLGLGVRLAALGLSLGSLGATVLECCALARGVVCGDGRGWMGGSWWLAKNLIFGLERCRGGRLMSP